MDLNQLKDTFVAYDKRIANASIQARQIATNRRMDQFMRLQHARWMCQEMVRKINTVSGDIHALEMKANRWLGFVQATLHDAGYYVIDELKLHNS